MNEIVAFSAGVIFSVLVIGLFMAVDRVFR